MYALQAKTATALEQYKQQVARANGAETYAAPFEVRPAVTNKLIDRYQKETEFLNKINMIQVRDQAGQKLGLGANRTIASTTDTRIQPRRPVIIGDLEAIDDYLCTPTNYDTAIDWRMIDTWSEFSDFQIRLANLTAKLVAQDKQRIGFNGKHRAKTSNRTLYPSLQDVNVGWLEKIRAYSPERYLSTVTIGKAQEFKNLDALVEMARHELIAEQYRNSGDLVVITSASLVTNKYLQLINADHAPTESIAAATLYQNKILGTMTVDTPAFFPTDSILITSYDNLSIYMQQGSHRRFLRDEPEWDRTADYQSVNECFVVEDYEKVVLFDNVIVEK